MIGTSLVAASQHLLQSLVLLRLLEQVLNGAPSSGPDGFLLESDEEPLLVKSQLDAQVCRRGTCGPSTTAT